MEFQFRNDSSIKRIDFPIKCSGKYFSISDLFFFIPYNIGYKITNLYWPRASRIGPADPASARLNFQDYNPQSLFMLLACVGTSQLICV